MARKNTTPAEIATSRFAPLTESDIKVQTDGGSVSRGRTYFRQGHIHDTVLRDGTIEALCEGSDVQPYRVRATLLPHGKQGANPHAFSCTCPRGGFCKHIVALLLTWIDNPERFAERPSLTDRLADKSREELIALVERMVQRYPDLERLVELPLPVSPDGVGGASANEVTVDEAIIRRQVRSALAGFTPSDYGWGNSWNHGVSVPTELRTLLELGQSYVTAEQWGNAHVVLAALSGEIIEESEEWMFTYDETGELGGIIIACDAGMAVCLDAQAELPEHDRLSPEVREELIGAIYRVWQYDVFDFGGYDLSQEGPEAIVRNATAAERAMAEGWLREERADGWSKRSVVSFLMLLREFDGASDDDILALYQEAELWNDVAVLMVRMARIDEAVAVAGRHLRTAPSLIAFADVLIAHGPEHVGRAIALVDDLAWEVEGTNAGHEATLQNWLIDQFSRHDRPQEALKLADRRFRRQPSIQTYRSTREVAELPGQPHGTWAGIRLKLDEYLREQQAWAVLVDVYLDEGDVKAALDAFDQLGKQRRQRQQGSWAPISWGYGDQELRLAQSAERDFPDRAVPIYRRRAEELIDRRQRSNYQIAAGHLLRAKETLHRHDRADEWTRLIAGIRESNRTLRALREELDNLDLQ